MEHRTIAIIGLGYVGLPLAVEFAKKFPVIGFDIKNDRVQELANGKDSTLEVDAAELEQVIAQKNTPLNPGQNGLWVTDNPELLSNAHFFIVTVPTPVDKNNHPDLTPLYKASETVGNYLKKGDIVVYESTVYPGATEEECVPILEAQSGLKYNHDFFVGYSPERINPGDKVHTVTKILKITSGSTPEVAKQIDTLYQSIIVAGTYLAPSIKVAEAAKVIENSQRDINIAFVNELAKIFKLMQIDTQEVLKAAGTKWNFLPFSPGLVGGHCIGVDPYYLAQKAIGLGYNPEIILAGRRLNDSMGSYVAHDMVKLMVKNDMTIKHAEVLVLGITFKENCPDIRNSRVIDIINELKSFDIQVSVCDPWANAQEVLEEYGIAMVNQINENKKYQGLVLAVAHDDFKELNLANILHQKHIVYDVKSILPKEMSHGRL